MKLFLFSFLWLIVFYHYPLAGLAILLLLSSVWLAVLPVRVVRTAMRGLLGAGRRIAAVPVRIVRSRLVSPRSGTASQVCDG